MASLAILLDNARGALAAAHAAGLETPALFISVADYDQVRRTKSREVGYGLPALVLGVEVRPVDYLAEGEVQLAEHSEL